MRKLVLLMCMSLALSACGKEEKKESFSYDFTENGCKTGEHKAESKEAYCANLKNESLNNFCAYSMRRQAYESNGCGSW